ncbi:MAG: DUF1592 domain-containing protein [Deltaproteobacteria bacterium]|nr:DUF1592 domain-containing protein [Nannocystaceae bacterium]
MQRNWLRSHPRLHACVPVLALLAAAGCRGDAAHSDDGDTASDETGADATGVTADPTAGPSDDGSSDNGEGADESSGDETGEQTSYLPPPGGLRRLLAHQYVDSIEHVLGPEAAAAALPPVDQTLGGFDSIAAAELSPSPADVELYERSANAIALAAVTHPETMAEVVPCIVDAVPAAGCYQELVTEIGRLIWRRPLTDDEITAYANLAFYAQGWAEGDFMPGAQYVLVALLQSPRFLYIVELGTPADDGVARELDQFELAARMSFFLLGRTPDRALLDLADAGELGTDDQLRDVAWQLLDDSRAAGTVARFYDEFLTIRDLPNKGKSAELFPLFSAELAASMREETQRLITDVVFEQDGNVLDIFDAPYTFVDGELAALYGVAAPPAGQWAQIDLPGEQGRAGVLSQPSMMAMLSHGEVNSPTRRGLFVQEQLLCHDIPPTPPGVNPTLPDVTEPMSLRQRLEEVHLSEESCAGCHKQMDPIGFAFEHFDAIGAYRTTDNGFAIDSSGNVDGLGEFADAADLALLIRDDPRLHRCLVDQVYTQALGFPQTPDQLSPLDTIDEEFAASEYNLKQLLVELTASPVFRRVDEPK